MFTEESYKWCNKLYMIFIDFEKTFDSLDRQSPLKLLRYYCILDIIVKLIMAMYEDTTSCVRTSEGKSRIFPILSRVKQGCVLSPLLGTLVIKYISRSIESTGLRPHDRLISYLNFDDDIAILDTCKTRLQELLSNIQQKVDGFRLKVNVSKIKGVATSDSPMKIKCSDNDEEQVVNFKYLGSTIENTGSTAKEVIARIGQTNIAFNRINKACTSSTFSLRLKLHLFSSNVLPVLLFALETWYLSQERKIQSFENACLRRLRGINWTQKVANVYIRNMTGHPSHTETI
ncbi:uncharacterized protein LOC136030600 [Artemia franciscana]|uniref:uncharacterized protein LOC136030600 n=1 Tax=Artemia franciscana TaxID=6661 RepID=UPI0032DA73A6